MTCAEAVDRVIEDFLRTNVFIYGYPNVELQSERRRQLAKEIVQAVLDTRPHPFCKDCLTYHQQQTIMADLKKWRKDLDEQPSIDAINQDLAFAELTIEEMKTDLNHLKTVLDTDVINSVLAHDRRFEKIEEQFEQMENERKVLHHRFVEVEQIAAFMKEQESNFGLDIIGLKKRVESLERRLDNMNRNLPNTHAFIDERLKKLEMVQIKGQRSKQIAEVYRIIDDYRSAYLTDSLTLQLASKIVDAIEC